jgi:hypothetical protein
MTTHADQLQTILEIMQDGVEKTAQQLPAPIFNFNGGRQILMTGPVNLVMSCGPDGALNLLPASLPGQVV